MSRIIVILLAVVLFITAAAVIAVVVVPQFLDDGSGTPLPEVAVLPTATETLTLVPPTLTSTPTLTVTPSPTYTPSLTYTPIIVVATYTPTLTYTPSMTFTPSNTPTPSDTPTKTPVPSYTPTEDQPAPVVLAVGPDFATISVPKDQRCGPTTTAITAQVDSSVGLYTIRLNYVFNGAENHVIDMAHHGEGIYSANVGPFNEPGRIAYWISMSDNWGKWTNYPPQEMLVSDCDVEALNATEAAILTAAGTATALATQGFTGNPNAFQAANLTYDTPYQKPVTVTFNAINGTQPYQFLLSTVPANGTVVTIDGFSVSYTPNAGFFGQDTFTYVATDANGLSDTGIIRINVNDSDLNAQDRVLNVPDNSTNFVIDLTATDGILPYVATSVDTAGLTGNLIPDPSNMFRYYYTPPSGFLGTTSFTWTVQDSAPVIDSGTITLNVGPVAVTGRMVYELGGNVTIANADGSGPTSLAAGADPVLSPDGQHIAYTSGGNIYVMEDDGANVTQMTVNAASETQAAWSPNGQRIAYVSEQGGNPQIYWFTFIAGTPPSSYNQVTNTLASVDNLHPTWLDNDAMLYQSNAAGDWDIHRATVSAGVGGGAAPWFTQAGDQIRPNAAGDGSVVVMESAGQVAYVQSDASGFTTVISGNRPSWSPDTSQIVYDAGGSIHRVWRNGSNDVTVVVGIAPNWR